MKKLFAAITLTLLSGLASAQAQIRVMYFFTPNAVAYVQNTMGLTLSEYGAHLTENVNWFMTQSNVQANFTTTATINGEACCQGLDHLYSSQTLGIPGVMSWAQNSIPLNFVRDATSADVVVVVGDYDDGTLNPPNDVPGVSMGNCASGNGGPKNAYVGINIRHQELLTPNEDLLAHELGHQMCMTHDGWYKKTGSTPADCEVRWTMEYGDGSDALMNYPSTTSACWQLQGDSTHRCYGSEHAAIVSFVTTNNLQNCTYANGVMTGGGGVGSVWSEFVNCPFWGFTQRSATRFTDAVNPPFTCVNAVQLPYYASFAPPPGQSGGTLVRNSVAAMNAQAAIVQTFRDTKMTGRLIGAMFGWN